MIFIGYKKMFELRSQRLRIIPLDLEEFRLFLTDIQGVEKKLGLVKSGEDDKGHFIWVKRELV